MIITDFHITCFGIAWKHDDDFDMDNYYTIMQYTGLKDKKGVEIYEGDIVHIDRSENLFGEVKRLDGGQYYIHHQKCQLKYKHQIHCEVCDAETALFFLNYFDAYELSVIGNIYQSAS